MNFRSPPLTTGRVTRQNGISLIIALLFLVILTLLGIGVFSTTISEERMARNFRDKEIALQGAEAALNEAKVLITGSYSTVTTATPTTVPVPLSEQNCYITTPPGFSCDPNLIPVDSTRTPVVLDLFSGTVTGAPLGQLDTTLGTSAATAVSPIITGFSGGAPPRYLVVWQAPVNCGASNTGACFLIVAQSRGRLDTTRVNLAELFTF